MMSDSIKDISKLKVADLKRELKVRGLSTVGNKQELQDRLQLALQDDSALLLDDTGTVDTEDILNEDDVLADEDDSNTDLNAKVGSSSLKRHLDEDLDEDTVTSTPAVKSNASQGQDNGPPAKKITLNRKVLSQQAPSAASEKKEEEKKPEDTHDDKKVVKLSEISMKERLALRAVKFGAPVSNEAKKLARSARFGDSTSGDSKKEARAARFGLSASSVTSASNVPEVNADVLKKRAERFGIPATSKIGKAEVEEKKKQRLERFGSGSTAATNGSSKVAASKPNVSSGTPKPGRIPIMAPSPASNKTSTDDKKKLRAERFKTNAVVTAK